MRRDDTETYDYVVVGSGAGGGPVAARLARAGFSVLLLEAGGDDGGLDYLVPAFHARATEHPELRWDYYVRHYADPQRRARDSKYVQAEDGVLYPRAATLGGCTAHNAMITVYPHASDFDDIAEATGDRSWRATAMRRHFERLERCDYVERPRLMALGRLTDWLVRILPWSAFLFRNVSRHGWRGWLHTNIADPALAVRDRQLIEILKGATKATLVEFLRRPLTVVEGLDTYFDPNDWRVQSAAPEGLWFIPLAVRHGRRNGTRELIEEVTAAHPDRLVVRTHALATRVLLADRRAVGVEYAQGRHLFRADPAAGATSAAPPVGRVEARREVILAAGAFNTPQLLKLSGIGPADELRRFGIDVVVDLPGVGENLQDRYEVAVVTEMAGDFAITGSAPFAPPTPGAPADPSFAAWEQGHGVYTTNGAVIGITRRSRPELAVPDLFIFGLPADFRGYHPGYASELLEDRNTFTWAVLKAHTNNTAGRVTLRSADPFDTPVIDFSYFDEGSPGGDEDLDAVVAGIEFVRSLMHHAAATDAQERLPGDHRTTKEQLREFVRDEAWGHHASCTCKIGAADDPTAVLDTRFRVRGVEGLRVVDASVFPRIPGFFIVSAIYMVAEKAADAILADARRDEPVRSAMRGARRLVQTRRSRPRRKPERGDLASSDPSS